MVQRPAKYSIIVLNAALSTGFSAQLHSGRRRKSAKGFRGVVCCGSTLDLKQATGRAINNKLASQGSHRLEERGGGT